MQNFVMETDRMLLSEELNKFKDKLAQNWFINDHQNNYFKHKEKSKQSKYLFFLLFYSFLIK